MTEGELQEKIRAVMDSLIDAEPNDATWDINAKNEILEIVSEMTKEFPKWNDEKYHLGGGVYDVAKCNRDRGKWFKKWLGVE